MIRLRSNCFSVGTWLALVALSYFSGHAQYHESREYESLGLRGVYAGLSQKEFRPTGSNILSAGTAIEFAGLAPSLGFRQGSVDVNLSYLRYRLGGRDRSSLSLAARFTNELHLLGKKSSHLIFPIQILTDFVKAENIGFEKDNFNVTSAGIGGGLKYRFSKETFDFSVMGIQSAMIAFEGLGTSSGFSAATSAEALCVFKNALVFDGVFLGYRMRYQVWSMSNKQFNYNSFSHGVFVGVLF